MVNYYQDQKIGQDIPRVLGQALKGRKEAFTFGEGRNDDGPGEIFSLDANDIPGAMEPACF